MQTCNQSHGSSHETVSSTINLPGKSQICSLFLSHKTFSFPLFRINFGQLVAYLVNNASRQLCVWKYLSQLAFWQKGTHGNWRLQSVSFALEYKMAPPYCYTQSLTTRKVNTCLWKHFKVCVPSEMPASPDTGRNSLLWSAWAAQTLELLPWKSCALIQHWMSYCYNRHAGIFSVAALTLGIVAKVFMRHFFLNLGKFQGIVFFFF